MLPNALKAQNSPHHKEGLSPMSGLRLGALSYRDRESQAFRAVGPNQHQSTAQRTSAPNRQLPWALLPANAQRGFS